MPGLLSRRRPYPYDQTINGVGVMLAPDPQTGQIRVERKAVTGDEVTPQVYDYGAYSPFVEKPYVFGRLTGGMGEALQRTASPTRYKRCRRVDRSIGGMARLGPYFQAQSFPAGLLTNGVTAFLTTGTGGSDRLAFQGRYALRRASPSAWALDKDFGNLAYVNQVTTYAPVGGAFGQTYAAVGQGLYNYNPGTGLWTSCALPVGMSAFWVERNQAELWIADATNVIRKTTGDPLSGAGAWGGPIYVGDASSAITGLKSLHGQLFVTKSDGVYSVNTDGTVNDLFPEIRTGGRRPTNGSAAAVWRDRFWFRLGDGFAYLTGGATATLTPIGPERLLEATGIAGVPVAFVGHDNWFGYLAVYDAATNTSNLLKYGTWVPADTATTPGYQFAEVWHGSIAEWTGQVTSLWVESPITSTVDVSFPTRANPWLWVGFADGHVEYTPLPVGLPDPAQDPACVFATAEAYTDWPDHHAMAQADVKHFRAFVAEGPRLDATNFARIGYRTDPSAAFTLLPTDLTATGLRASTPAAGITGVTLQVREYLIGTRTTTPQLEAVTLLEQVRPGMLKRVDLAVRAERNLLRRDGLVDRRTGEQIRAQLVALADGSKAPGTGPVTVVWPDETSEQFDVVDYQAGEFRGYGLGWRVSLTLVGFTTNTVLGTWDRALGHTWDDAAAYTWDTARTW